MRKKMKALAAAAAITVGAAGAAAVASGDAGAVQGPLGTCNTSLYGGSGGVSCYANTVRFYAVLVYNHPTWYGTQIKTIGGPCVWSGNSIVSVPNYNGGDRAIGVNPHQC
jgi:hypothetical protein